MLPGRRNILVSVYPTALSALSIIYPTDLGGVSDTMGNRNEIDTSISSMDRGDTLAMRDRMSRAGRLVRMTILNTITTMIRMGRISCLSRPTLRTMMDRKGVG